MLAVVDYSSFCLFLPAGKQTYAHPYTAPFQSIIAFSLDTDGKLGALLIPIVLTQPTPPLIPRKLSALPPKILPPSDPLIFQPIKLIMLPVLDFFQTLLYSG